MRTQGFERRFSQNLHLFREKSHKTLTLPTFHIYSANPIYLILLTSAKTFSVTDWGIRVNSN